MSRDRMFLGTASAAVALMALFPDFGVGQAPTANPQRAGAAGGLEEIV